MQHAASWKADLVRGDVRQAFLNAEKIDRKIFLDCPGAFRLPGVLPGSVIVPNTSGYELADAPRQWWQKMKSILTKAGWQGRQGVVMLGRDW